MRVPSQRVRSAIASLTLVFGAAGCGCDAWGCADGLYVRLDHTPASPWTIELLVNGVLQPGPPGATCDGSRQCDPAVRYDMLPRNGVSIRVTTPTGVRTTILPRIDYTGQQRSDHCHDCRGQAFVTANIP